MEGKLFYRLSKGKERKAKRRFYVVGDAVFKPFPVGIQKNVRVIASAFFVGCVIVGGVGSIDEDPEVIADIVKDLMLFARESFGKAKTEQIAKDGGGGIDGGDPFLFKC